VKRKFLLLKNALTHTSVLQIADSDKPFKIYCDVTGIATDGFLVQQGPDRRKHPIAY